MFEEQPNLEAQEKSPEVEEGEQEAAEKHDGWVKNFWEDLKNFNVPDAAMIKALRVAPASAAVGGMLTLTGRPGLGIATALGNEVFNGAVGAVEGFVHARRERKHQEALQKYFEVKKKHVTGEEEIDSKTLAELQTEVEKWREKFQKSKNKIYGKDPKTTY